MTGVWDFPEIDEFEQFLVDGIQMGIETALEESDNEDILRGLRFLQIDRFLVVNEWGDGLATVGEDGLDILVSFDLQGVENESSIEDFDMVARTASQTFIALINNGEIAPPPLADEWFPSYAIEPIAANRVPENINRQLGDRVGSTVADLTNRVAIQWRDREDLRLPQPVGENPVETIVSALPKIPFEELREDEEEAEVEEDEPDEPELEEPKPEEQEEPEDEPLTLIEEINQSVREFSISEEQLEVPAGKPTKRVDKRPLYEFELKLGLPSDVIGELDGLGPGDQFTDGVGFLAEIKKLGSSVPPSTFPRTSSYIKHYLSNRGPGYALGMYKSLVFYSAFISSYYGMRMKPGTYSSFREFLYRLYEIGERGGPQLVERLSQQEAASRGLETIPDHPTLEGEKAPWLENRQYYKIVEDNFGHEAWNDPTEYLYEELPPEEG